MFSIIGRVFAFVVLMAVAWSINLGGLWLNSFGPAWIKDSGGRLSGFIWLPLMIIGWTCFVGSFAVLLPKRVWTNSLD